MKRPDARHRVNMFSPATQLANQFLICTHFQPEHESPNRFCHPI